MKTPRTFARRRSRIARAKGGASAQALRRFGAALRGVTAALDHFGAALRGVAAALSHFGAALSDVAAAQNREAAALSGVAAPLNRQMRVLCQRSRHFSTAHPQKPAATLRLATVGPGAVVGAWSDPAKIMVV